MHCWLVNACYSKIFNSNDQYVSNHYYIGFVYKNVNKALNRVFKRYP